MNYFELFGFPVAPKVDKKKLAEKYFELQKKNHPDFFTQGSDGEKDEALQQSADINKAFATFKNEEKTIEYFLQQKGFIDAGEKYQLPPDFLMQMMELNETLTEKDGVTLAAEMADLEKSLYEEVKPLLEQPEFKEDPASMEKLKAYYYKKKYLNRILVRLGD
jgi:molecular chaperone HscB